MVGPCHPSNIRHLGWFSGHSVAVCSKAGEARGTYSGCVQVRFPRLVPVVPTRMLAYVSVNWNFTQRIRYMERLLLEVNFTDIDLLGYAHITYCGHARMETPTHK